jgi:hypothetical protein
MKEVSQVSNIFIRTDNKSLSHQKEVRKAHNKIPIKPIKNKKNFYPIWNISEN